MHEKAQAILSKASNILEERAKTHGSSDNTMVNIAALWGEWLLARGLTDQTLTTRDVAVMLSLLKMARICNTINEGTEHDDNWIDGAAYLAIGGSLA